MTHRHESRVIPVGTVARHRGHSTARGVVTQKTIRIGNHASALDIQGPGVIETRNQIARAIPQRARVADRNLALVGHGQATTSLVPHRQECRVRPLGAGTRHGNLAAGSDGLTDESRRGTGNQAPGLDVNSPGAQRTHIETARVLPPGTGTADRRGPGRAGKLAHLGIVAGNQAAVGHVERARGGVTHRQPTRVVPVGTSSCDQCLANAARFVTDRAVDIGDQAAVGHVQRAVALPAHGEPGRVGPVGTTASDRRRPLTARTVTDEAIPVGNHATIGHSERAVATIPHRQPFRLIPP